MIRFRDSISIRASPDQLFSWLTVMPQEYTRWHPDHVECRLLKGSMLEVGAEALCREYLHGRLHSMRFRIRNADPPNRIDFTIAGLGDGSFQAIPEADRTSFVAELGIGSRTPLVGPLIDALLQRLFPARLSAMRQHMREEGENLKRIMESGWSSPSSDAV